MDPDPDPRIHASDLWIRILLFSSLTFKMPTKTIFVKTFSCLLLFEGTFLHSFPKIKSQKESQNSRNQGFSYYFCMMTEGSGSIPLTAGSGSGSRRPKNMWIRWIRMLGIRIQSRSACFWASRLRIRIN